MKKNYLPVLLLLSALFMTCESIEKFTIVRTVEVKNITGTSADITGMVVFLSNKPHPEYGFCYSTTQNPAYEGDKKQLSGVKKGEFNANLSGLNPNTTYHVRAYVLDDNEPVYSQQQSFKTTEAVLEISAASKEITADSGTFSFTINANIPWTISENDEWIEISQSSGNDTTSITVTYGENTTNSERKSEITISATGISSKTIQVTQLANEVKKTLEISANTLNISTNQGTVNFTITSNTDWTIEGDAFWLNPDKTAGAGNDTIVLHFENNPSVNSRSTDITISSTGLQNKTIIITQAGKELTLAISTNTQSLTSQAGSFSFEVVSNTDWTIVNSEDWLHPDKTSGQENDSITIHYDENTSTGTRNAEISIDGGDAGTKTISVTQDGKTPDEKYVTIHFQEEWASAQKDSLKFEIESNTHWTTSEYANWFTLYPAVGDGDATITIEYDENTATEERSEKISINGTGVGLQSVTFTQSGADPLLLVSTNEITVSSAQGSITFDITSNLDWNVAEPETWLSAAPASGNGNGTITITYEENTQTIPRSLYIKVTALDVPEQTIVFTQEKPGETTGTVEDVDGNTYETVKIGEQWWMAENLATTQYNDNTEIPLVEDAGEWANLSTPAYCWYDNDDGVMKEEYGGLYNWHVVETGKVCPTGWHVPTDKEWKEMEMHLGMSRSDADDFGYRGEGIATKLKSTYGWDDGNGTNESGFNALPGGYRNNTDGSFYFDEWNGNWWTNTPSGDEYAWNREMFYNKDGVRRFDYDRKTGFSIRCVKD
jgi:uncharacterized protein (TIGR02145 family)